MRDVVADLRATVGEHAAEVLDVHGTRKALAAQDGVIVEAFGHATVREDVREIELATRLEHAEDLAREFFLER